MHSVMMGQRGTVVIPARLRRRYGLEEGSALLVEEHPDGVLLRPAVTLPVNPRPEAGERAPKPAKPAAAARAKPEPVEPEVEPTPEPDELDNWLG